jgi:hypothetical protein
MCIMVQLVVIWGLLYYIACLYYIVIKMLVVVLLVAWMHGVCMIVSLDLYSAHLLTVLL